MTTECKSCRVNAVLFGLLAMYAFAATVFSGGLGHWTIGPDMVAAVFAIAGVLFTAGARYSYRRARYLSVAEPDLSRPRRRIVVQL